MGYKKLNLNNIRYSIKLYIMKNKYKPSFLIILNINSI